MFRNVYIFPSYTHIRTLVMSPAESFLYKARLMPKYLFSKKKPETSCIHSLKYQYSTCKCKNSKIKYLKCLKSRPYQIVTNIYILCQGKTVVSANIALFNEKT